MMNTVKLDIGSMTKDLMKVKVMLSMTDNMATAEVCNLYIELCQKVAQGIQFDEATGKVVEKMTQQIMDNKDRPSRHSIAGHMNDPSEMQQKAFKEENEDE